MNIRVLTLNVWNQEGDPRRVAAINRELRALDPDIVGFQEVVYAADHNQLDELLRGMNHHWTHQAQVMASKPPKTDRYGGNAVATRWPHQLVEAVDMRLSDAQDVPWCTLAVSVPIPGEGDVLFIVTTTSWRPEAESARERQAIALSDLDARHRRDLPTIIAGDFTAEPDSACIRYLSGLQSLNGRSVHYHDTWKIAGGGPGYTWTADNPNARSVIDQIIRQPSHRRRIDYIFIGSWYAHPKAQCRVRSARLAFDKPDDGVWASDHFGVVVDLEIAKDA